MDLISNPYFSIALIVLGFGFLIFVHELGHFLVAKMVGIKATQFAIGFGHSLLTWRKGIGFRVGTTEPEYEKRIQEAYQAKLDEQSQAGENPAGLTTEQADQIAAELGLGETEYRLNYIPLGGYVKMLGQEDMDPTARSSDPRSFNNKSISARFAVISAGVIMNIIFGLIFFIIAFMSGVEFPPAIVGGVLPQSPAATSYATGHEGDPAYRGLRIGDTVTQADEEPIGDMMDLMYITILARGDTPIKFHVLREGEPDGLTFMMTPEPGGMKMLSIGVEPPVSLEVYDVLKDSDAKRAGVAKNMRITAVDGEAVDSYAAYHRAVGQAKGRAVTVTLADPKTGKTAEMKVAAFPKLVQQEDTPPNLLGMVPPAVVTSFPKENKPAEQAGMRVGDLIAAAGGQAWPDIETFQQIINDAQDTPVQITVWRDGKEVVLDPVTPQALADRWLIGVGIGYAIDTPLIGRTLPGSAMDTSPPIVGGSKLISIAGEKIESWADAQRVLGSLQAQGDQTEVAIEYELNLADRPQEQATAVLDPQTLAELKWAGWASPIPKGVSLVKLQEPVVVDDPIEAAAIGFEKTHQFITKTYLTLVRLTQGTVPPDKLSGPVGIVHQGKAFAERGWGYLLFFLGLISVNLAVINFLPIPITDGGLAIFLLIEKIKGSPVSVRVQTAATVMGLALLACVFLYVTYNDVLRLMGLS